MAIISSIEQKLNYQQQSSISAHTRAEFPTTPSFLNRTAMEVADLLTSAFSDSSRLPQNESSWRIFIEDTYKGQPDRRVFLQWGITESPYRDGKPQYQVSATLGRSSLSVTGFEARADNGLPVEMQICAGVDTLRDDLAREVLMKKLTAKVNNTCPAPVKPALLPYEELAASGTIDR